MKRTLAALMLGFGLWAQVQPSPARSQASALLSTLDEGDRVVLRGNTHPALARAVPLGRPPDTLPMTRILLSLNRPPGAQAALDALLAAQQDPASPRYHQWLTPEQFGQAYGATPETVQTVTLWLQSHGFTVEPAAPNRTLLEFSGTRAQVEETFRTAIVAYELDGERRLANAADPSIPRGLAGMIHGIVSLHNLQRKAHHSALRPAATGRPGPAYTSGGSHEMAPADFATIYNLTPLYAGNWNGAGTTIGIVARSNIRLSDVAAFRSTFGLAANAPTITLNGTDPGLVAGDQDENTLDTEWSGAVAPGATVDVVVSKSTGSTDGVDLSSSYLVNNNLASVMSASYGECEPDLGVGGNDFYRDLWAQAASQGITVVVSTGDSGPAGCNSGSDTTGSGQSVNGLASTPSNVAVGGTEFDEGSGTYWNASNTAALGSALGYIPELPWDESADGVTYPADDSGLWAAGSGVSTLYAKPAWQVATGVPADGMRDLPDVALSAASHDAYLICENGAYYDISGTSAAAPSMAGILAILVQKTGARLGNANVRLYELGQAQYGAAGTAVFHDVTSGNTTVPGVTGFTAAVGYDLATGLGSVNAQLLANSWNASLAVPAVTSFTPTTGPAGTSFAITGTGFTGATAVKVHTTSANFTVNSDTSISATVPAGATSGTVSVTNGAGTGTSSGTFTMPAPTVTSITPTSGPAGTSVALSGTGFTGATAVTFNGTAATAFTVTSDTGLTATVPAGATTGTVSVTTPNGTGTGGATFTVLVPPAVTSFTPTSGHVGASIAVTGTNFTGATSVRFNGVSTTPSAVTATSLSATVPAGATSGPVSVTTPGGTGASASSFTVPAPAITTFAPATGQAGTTVTLTGTGFSGATAVKFNGTTATSVTVNSDTTITATVPAGTTTGTLAVTTPAGTGTSSGTYTMPPPGVSAFTPLTGPAGTSVTLTGVGFMSATAVKFNGTAATFLPVTSDTSITTSVPVGATTGTVAVTTPNGTGTSSGTFTMPAPTVTSFTPTSGPAGTSVALSGTGFTGATVVTFNGTAATPFTVTSDTGLTATVPAGATTGTVAVTTPNGTGTGGATFTVLVPPAVTSFTPTSGHVGASIAVTGTNFIGATSVRFNGVSTTPSAVTATSLSATVPAGATTGPVSVTTPGGTGASASSFTVPAPAITTFAPATGQADTTVTLTGTGFSGATAVKFNGTAATSVTVNSDTTITATVPAGTTTGTLAVTTPAGTGTSSGTYTMPPPGVSAFTPLTGPAGTSVILTGVGFMSATAVKFNGTTATFLPVTSDTSITTSVPVGATTGTVAVTTPNGTGTSAASFTVPPPPVIASFAPTSGRVGTPVVLTGTTFTYATAVRFNGTSAPLTVNSPTAISTTVPSGASTGPISVTDPDGTGTSTASFTILPPVVTSFTPTTGQAGTSITLTGFGFSGTTAVKFNGTAATFLQVLSDTSLTVSVPAGATTGAITVTAPTGTATTAGSFTILLPPTVTSFTPALGMAGTSVTVTGTRFTGATGITFNGVAATAFSLASDTSLTVTVPAGAMTGPIAVTTPDGTGTSAGSFTLSLPPAITSFTPASGPATTVVSLAGSGFTGARAVTFNGNPATSFTVLSDGAVTATVPFGTTTGPVSVTTPSGTGTASGAFTIAASATAVTTLDLGGEGVVDVLDLALLARAYGSTPSSSNWNPAADLNGDGVVNAADLDLFLAGL